MTLHRHWIHGKIENSSFFFLSEKNCQAEPSVVMVTAYDTVTSSFLWLWSTSDVTGVDLNFKCLILIRKAMCSCWLPYYVVQPHTKLAVLFPQIVFTKRHSILFLLLPPHEHTRKPASLPLESFPSLSYRNIWLLSFFSA